MGISTLEATKASTATRAVALRPPAKLNLSLVVFPRRPDGYHSLHSIMATVDLHDDLYLARAGTPGVHIHCTGRASPHGRDNLVYRAAELLADYGKASLALDIHLHKRIPAGAGLGGASSDAASCLLGLNRLWNLGLDREELCQLGVRLGSDVPFFLHAPVALCRGRGDEVAPMAHRCRQSVLLIIPNVQVSTKEVYQNYQSDDFSNDAHMRRVHYFLRRGDLDGLTIQGINSLTCTSMEMCAAMRNLRVEVENMGIGPVHMSGSGSCMFVVSDSSEQIAYWAEQIQERELAEVEAVSFQEHFEPFVEVHRADIGNQN